MKNFVAFVLLVTLACSATASTHNAIDLMMGFTVGLNHSQLNPSLAGCTFSINNVTISANEAVIAANDTTPEVFEQAVAKLGYDFAHAIRACGFALAEIRNLTEDIRASIETLDQTVLSNRFFKNVFIINQKFIQIKKDIALNDYTGAGMGIASIFNILVLGKEPTTPRTVRQLGEITNLVSPGMIFNLNATILGFQGFIEEANTTIAIGDYLTFVNDTTAMVNLFPVLEKAIDAFDFPTIVRTVTTISKAIPVVGADFNNVKNQTNTFIQRDLPLFASEEGIAKAVTSLVSNLPTTIYNIQRITNSYKNADYKELGHGTGGLYNQLRNGAIGN